MWFEKPLNWMQLARSMVQGRTGVGHEVSNVRTSKTAWLPEGLHPLLNRLTRRISLITGLKTNPISDEAELLQVFLFNPIQLFKLFPNSSFLRLLITGSGVITHLITTTWWKAKRISRQLWFILFFRFCFSKLWCAGRISLHWLVTIIVQARVPLLFFQ